MLRLRSFWPVLGVSIVLAGSGCGRSKQVDLLRIELQESYARESAWHRTADSLRTIVRSAPGSSTEIGNSPLINGTSLVKSGLSNAATNLAPWLNDQHPELIPFDGVLGGTMRFQRAVPLVDQFVFAEVSDGHVQGYLLLRYEPAATGPGFDWKTVYEWRNQ